MRRTIYIPIALILIAVSIVAIARAQQWNAWTGTPGGQGHHAAVANSQVPQLPPMQGQQVAANQPNRIHPQGATPLPSRFAQQPSLPPLMIENKFATDPNWGRPQPTVVQTSAIEPSPSDVKTNQPSDDQVAAPQPFSSRRQVATPTFTNVNESYANDRAAIAPPQLPEPHRLAQATEQVAATNEGQSIDQRPTSRRPQSLRDSLIDGDEKTPRLAQRQARGESLPAIDLQGAGKLLFQAEAPALSVTMAGPAKIGVGKTSEYKIAIKNSSRVDAEDVNVVLDLPGWAEVISSEGTLGAARHESVIGDHHRIKWNIFQLEAGATETLTLKLVARESRSFELAVNWTHSPKTHVTQIEVQEAKLEMQLTGPRDVLYGETKTYTITVANPGTGPAENVVINLLPITPGQDKAGVSNLGTIEAGGRREIEIDLTARQAGHLELRAQAFADAGLRAEAAEAILVRRGALEAVVGGPEIKYAGTVAAYQLQVANTGDAMAENVVAEAILPRSSNFVSASDGGELTEATGRVQWKVGALRPGATRTFELRCVLAEAGGNRVEVITSADDDLTSAAHCVTQVEALADLKLLINDPQGPVPAGEPIVYEVRIINRGTKAAEGVQIATFFSDGIEPLSVDGGRAEIGIGQVVFHPIGRVVAGQEVVYRITAKAETAGNHTFRTEVACASPETKLAAQETTRFYGGAAENHATPNHTKPGHTKPTQSAEAKLDTPSFDTSRFGERR